MSARAVSPLPGLDLALYREMASPNKLFSMSCSPQQVWEGWLGLVWIGKGESAGLDVTPELVIPVAGDANQGRTVILMLTHWDCVCDAVETVTPAPVCVLCRCGDMIVAVNGLSTVGMSHSALVPMLKEQRNKVTLTVICWPGSLV